MSTPWIQPKPPFINENAPCSSKTSFQSWESNIKHECIFARHLLFNVAAEELLLCSYADMPNWLVVDRDHPLWWSTVIILYGGRLQSSFMAVDGDHTLWWSTAIILYGGRPRSSFMAVDRDHLLWWSTAIILYGGRLRSSFMVVDAPYSNNILMTPVLLLSVLQ